MPFLSDTRHFRHFRRCRGSEEPNPCFQWVECKFVIFAVFVKTAPFWQETKTRFTKNTVCATPTFWSFGSFFFFLVPVWLLQCRFWGLKFREGHVAESLARVIAAIRIPKGPKNEKIQDRPPGLKFSIEIEIFKRATQQTPFFFWEFWRSGIENFKRDWNFQSRLKISIEIDFFQSLGP